MSAVPVHLVQDTRQFPIVTAATYRAQDRLSGSTKVLKPKKLEPSGEGGFGGTGRVREDTA
jgi:hypothetical protein